MKRGHIRKAILTPIVMSVPVGFMLLAYREPVPNRCTVPCFLQDVDSTVGTKNRERVDGGNGEKSRQAVSQTVSGGARSSQNGK